MTFDEAMRSLKTAGTAQNRNVYARHGVTGAAYGVSYRELGQLAKRNKSDTDLARRLWTSGNHDARILATMVADAPSLKSAELDRWARDLSNYVVTDAFARLASGSPFAAKKMDPWMRSRDEWRARTGWLVCAHLAPKPGVITEKQLEGYLAQIESRIHKSENRAKDAMNSALIAIGLRSTKLEKRAVAAAKRIGKVDVDHGETSCKTPDAVAYIAKTKLRRAQKKTRR